MRQCLIIPDVHGREFWIDPCKHVDAFEQVIFLGDYLDHYNETVKHYSNIYITDESEVENFKSIIQFKKDNPQKCILLLGNHDCGYAFKEYFNAYKYHCRHNYPYHDVIAKLFDENKNLFCFAYEWNNCLFSHAGVTQQLYNDIAQSDHKLDEAINLYYGSEEHQGTDLYKCSFYRGGYDDYGSIVWTDLYEHEDWCPPGYDKQVFGHTYCAEPFLFEKMAMVDTGYDAYIIDENLNIKCYAEEEC